jgi:retron-type reverse transcriptase
MIKSKPGGLTPSFKDETLDGISLDWFTNAAGSIRNGKFQFKPARRTYIQKSNGKQRPLTMPSPRDKIIQEGMRYLLEIVFEPSFRDCSHGFRQGRGTHTAMPYIRYRFGATK